MYYVYSSRSTSRPQLCTLLVLLDLFLCFYPFVGRYVSYRSVKMFSPFRLGLLNVFVNRFCFLYSYEFLDAKHFRSLNFFGSPLTAFCFNFFSAQSTLFLSLKRGFSPRLIVQNILFLAPLTPLE